MYSKNGGYDSAPTEELEMLGVLDNHRKEHRFWWTMMAMSMAAGFWIIFSDRSAWFLFAFGVFGFTCGIKAGGAAVEVERQVNRIRRYRGDI